MVDAMLYNRAIALERSDILQRLGLTAGTYHLATIHRPRNTDDPNRLKTILQTLGELGLPVIFPAHPRAQKAIKIGGVSEPATLRIIPPVSYLDMIALEVNARTILTDSGGVQKEAYLVGVPCITLREETEWVETVEAGWNRLVGADPTAIRAAVARPVPEDQRPPLYGDGKAGERIVAILREG